jgi:nitrate/nitrite-specific signal transduction histidine kinase
MVLTVIDDGVGFDRHGVSGRASVGLIRMRKRVRILNRQFSLWPQEGEGTRIAIRVTVDPKAGTDPKEQNLNRTEQADYVTPTIR